MYDLELSQARSQRNTVHNLKISVGDLVYYRLFAYPATSKHLKHLMPRFLIAKVSKILGPTSLIVTDVKSDRQISRNLADVYLVPTNSSFPNLYLTGPQSLLDDFRELETTELIGPGLKAEIGIKIKNDRDKSNFVPLVEPSSITTDLGLSQMEQEKGSDRVLRSHVKRV